MGVIEPELINIPARLCGLFYAVLCIFSIVTGIIYMSGKRKLNPLELSEKFMERFKDDESKLEKFTRKMGLVTFIVGIVQGLTSYAFFKGHSIALFILAIAFTIFSICSVSFKLKGKINAFPIIKLIFYVLILIVLMLPSTREYFISTIGWYKKYPTQPMVCVLFL